LFFAFLPFLLVISNTQNDCEIVSLRKFDLRDTTPTAEPTFVPSTLFFVIVYDVKTSPKIIWTTSNVDAVPTIGTIFQSHNGGYTWTNQTEGLTSLYYYDIDTSYSGATVIHYTDGLYIYYDYGSTWPGSLNGVYPQYIAINPSGNTIVVASKQRASSNQAVLYSANNGTTWITFAPTQKVNCYGIAVDSTVYIFVYNTGGSTFYLTT
jgi:hypothetical protein